MIQPRHTNACKQRLHKINPTMNLSPPTHAFSCVGACSALLQGCIHAQVDVLQLDDSRFKNEKKNSSTKCNNTAPQCNCSGLLKVAEAGPELAKRRQLTAKHDTLQCRSCSFSSLFRLHISILAGMAGKGNLQKLQNWIFQPPFLKFQIELSLCSFCSNLSSRQADEEQGRRGENWIFLSTWAVVESRTEK